MRVFRTRSALVMGTIALLIGIGAGVNFHYSGVSAVGERGYPRRVAERVGRQMRVWQVGQAMTRSKAASRLRRAAGRLRLGGKAGHGVIGGVEEGVAPDEGDQGQMAVQARPGPALVVAEPELLFA